MFEGLGDNDKRNTGLYMVGFGRFNTPLSRCVELGARTTVGRLQILVENRTSAGEGRNLFKIQNLSFRKSGSWHYDLQSDSDIFTYISRPDAVRLGWMDSGLPGDLASDFPFLRSKFSRTQKISSTSIGTQRQTFSFTKGGFRTRGEDPTALTLPLWKVRSTGRAIPAAEDAADVGDERQETHHRLVFSARTEVVRAVDKLDWIGPRMAGQQAATCVPGEALE